MNITFLGFYDKRCKFSFDKFQYLFIFLVPNVSLLPPGDASKEPVKVETKLLKICHKKRKYASTPVMTVSNYQYWWVICFTENILNNLTSFLLETH